MPREKIQTGQAIPPKKTPKSLNEILEKFDGDEELAEFLPAVYYDVRYYPEENILSSSDIYSGRVRRQGLLTKFYKTLQEVIDFDDFNCLAIRGIVEKKTTDMFNPLRKKISNNDERSIVKDKAKP